MGSLLRVALPTAGCRSRSNTIKAKLVFKLPKAKVTPTPRALKGWVKLIFNNFKSKVKPVSKVKVKLVFKGLASPGVNPNCWHSRLKSPSYAG
jgi:hypothetical protein